MLRVGIVGAGAVALSHADAYRAAERCHLVAVAEVDETRGRQFAARCGAHWHADWRDLLEREDVDAVSICLPHSLHAPAVLDAAARRKHVLCEKPIATTIEDAMRMIHA
jgi:UDP-N-acetylglucosamine 3-dehydrogenase